MEQFSTSMDIITVVVICMVVVMLVWGVRFFQFTRKRLKDHRYEAHCYALEMLLSLRGTEITVATLEWQSKCHALLESHPSIPEYFRTSGIGPRTTPLMICCLRIHTLGAMYQRTMQFLVREGLLPEVTESTQKRFRQEFADTEKVLLENGYTYDFEPMRDALQRVLGIQV